MARCLTMLLVVLIVGATIIGGPRSTALAQDPAPGGQVTIGLDFEPDSLDPHVTPYAVSHTVMMNIFDTLVWRDLDGAFQPGLAESWSINDDGTEFTFVLRPDVTFHDGMVLDAEAVKVNFDRIADPETQSGFASTLLGPYDRGEVIDARTIKVIFSSPAPGFLDGASQAFLGIASPAALAEHGAEFGRNPVGSGSFRFVEWSPQDHITLARNDDYAWAPDIFDHAGPAYLDQVTFRFYAEGPTRLAALQADDAQVIDNVVASDILLLEGDASYTILRAEAIGLPIVIMLNTERPPTDDVAVRQALNFALDRQAVVDIAMFGQTSPATGPLAPGTPFYNAEVETLYPFDLVRAAAVLDEAGWVAGADGIREKDGQRLVIEWGVTPWETTWAELAQAQLTQIGAEVNITQMVDGAALDAVIANEINFYSTAWTSSDPVVLGTVFHSDNIDGGSALTKYADPALDALLEAGAQSIDEATRAEAYGDAQLLIMEQAIVIPTTLWTQHVAASATVLDLKRDFRNYLWLFDTHVAP